MTKYCDIYRLFRTVAKPRPCDNQLLIIYVVGGITTTEAKQIKDAVSSYHTNVQVSNEII